MCREISARVIQMVPQMTSANSSINVTVVRYRKRYQGTGIAATSDKKNVKNSSFVDDLLIFDKTLLIVAAVNNMS